MNATTLQHLTLLRLRAERDARMLSALRLVQLEQPRHRPIPVRLYVLAVAFLVATVVSAIVEIMVRL